ncbi:MAG TPA: flagellar hook-associated protein FlgL [bacterium]|nr:flagellar hook-associated protein FlgL [bacterium]
MRVTQATAYTTVLSNLQKNLEKADYLNYTISSGSTIRYTSDDPVGACQTIAYGSDISRTEQYLENIADADDWLLATDNAMSAVGDILKRVRTLTVQGSNDTYTAEEREDIASEINELLEELVNDANTQYGGRYLFGGTETVSGSPYTVTRNSEGLVTEVGYNGDSEAINREVDENTTLQINISGTDLFQVTNHVVTAGVGVADQTATLDATVGASQGYLSINGEKVYYDTTADSLDDLVARINATPQTGVTATIDTTAGNARLVLSSDDPEQMTLYDVDRNGNTAFREGLLNDLQIVDGSVALDSGGNYVDNIHANATETKVTAFSLLIKVRDDLLNSDADALGGEDLELLDAAQDQLLKLRAEVGGRQNRLEQKATRLADYKVQMTELLANTSDTDISKAVLELTQLQSVQTAALQAASKIFNLSLMNYMG